MAIQDTLGAALTLPNGQVLKNRLMKSAMSETLAPPSNRVPDSTATLYGRWASGGLGLHVTGNVMIDRRALGEPGNIVVEDERDLEALRRWAVAGQGRGARIWVQLNHPGRQVPRFLNTESVAPSAVPFRAELKTAFAEPRALTEGEIEDLIARFATSAGVIAKAGFDGVQIHGAHGYLVSQFLSPHTNRRTDRWGGSAENRRRFALEVYRSIRDAVGPDVGVSIKINSADFLKGGLTEEESAESIVALAEAGMDFIEISGGTYEAPRMVTGDRKKESTRRREAYFLSFAETVRSQLEIPLALTGGFRSGAAMAEAIESGAIDIVGLARPLVVDPDLPNRLLLSGDVRVDTPKRRLGIGMLDRGGMPELIWYERQIHRMASGGDPRPNESAIKAMLWYSLTHGVNGFRTRRGR